MFNSNAEKETKTLVIGIDGVPKTLLDNYLEKGYLPEFKKILTDGHKLLQMDASVPDVSSTSWTSFMTGVNPGEHGIYGFTDLRADTYDIFFPNANNITAPTVWDIIGQTGTGHSTLTNAFEGRFNTPKSSVVMNIPQTYPATQLNGVLTAGFVCPNLQKGTFPESAYDYLKSIGYLSDVDVFKAIEDRPAFFDEVFLALDKRLEAYEHYMNAGGWELFIGVITETDRMHHFFFDAAFDPDHECHDVFIKFYKRMDEIVGRLYNRFMEITNGNGLFMTMSDHGFTVIEQEVYLNAWLRKEGFLKLDEGRKYYDQVDYGTRAFVMDPGRIYLNHEGKYPRGAVKAGDAEAVRKEIIEKLEGFVDDRGNKIIRKIFTRDELYKGESAVNGPDIVCLANDGFDLKGKLDKAEVFGTSHFKGMHTSYDAHCIMPERVDTQARLHIEHLAGILLGNLG